jgi:hypothetical protein
MEFDVVIKPTNNHQIMVIAACGIFNYANVDDLMKDLRKILTNQEEVVADVHKVVKS